MYQLILALALVASATANVLLQSPCPAIKTADNFDFDTYAQGKWYEVGRYGSAQRKSKCGYSEYTREGDSAKIINYDYADGKFHSFEGSARASPESGKVIVTLPFGPQKTLGDFPYWILATDNKDYAIGYYCKYDEKKGSRQNFAWVLSRSKQLSDDDKAAIDGYLQTSDILDKSKLTWIDWSDEACKAV